MDYEGKEKIKAAPAARKLAKEYNIDLAEIKPSNNVRITAADVVNYVDERAKAEAAERIARKKAEDEARRNEEARREAFEKLKAEAEAEAARLKAEAEEEARLIKLKEEAQKAEAEAALARKKQEEFAAAKRAALESEARRQKAEAERKAQIEEEKRKALEAEAQRKQAEQARIKEEERLNAEKAAANKAAQQIKQAQDEDIRPVIFSVAPENEAALAKEAAGEAKLTENDSADKASTESIKAQEAIEAKANKATSEVSEAKTDEEIFTNEQEPDYFAPVNEAKRSLNLNDITLNDFILADEEKQKEDEFVNDALESLKALSNGDSPEEEFFPARSDNEDFTFIIEEPKTDEYDVFAAEETESPFKFDFYEEPQNAEPIAQEPFAAAEEETLPLYAKAEIMTEADTELFRLPEAETASVDMAQPSEEPEKDLSEQLAETFPISEGNASLAEEGKAEELEEHIAPVAETASNEEAALKELTLTQTAEGDEILPEQTTEELALAPTVEDSEILPEQTAEQPFEQEAGEPPAMQEEYNDIAADDYEKAAAGEGEFDIFEAENPSEIGLDVTVVDEDYPSEEILTGFESESPASIGLDNAVVLEADMVTTEYINTVEPEAITLPEVVTKQEEITEGLLEGDSEGVISVKPKSDGEAYKEPALEASDTQKSEGETAAAASELRKWERVLPETPYSEDDEGTYAADENEAFDEVISTLKESSEQVSPALAYGELDYRMELKNGVDMPVNTGNSIVYTDVEDIALSDVLMPEAAEETLSEEDELDELFTGFIYDDQEGEADDGIGDAYLEADEDALTDTVTNDDISYILTSAEKPVKKAEPEAEAADSDEFDEANDEAETEAIRLTQKYASEAAGKEDEYAIPSYSEKGLEDEDFVTFTPFNERIPAYSAENSRKAEADISDRARIEHFFNDIENEQYERAEAKRPVLPKEEPLSVKDIYPQPTEVRRGDMGPIQMSFSLSEEYIKNILSGINIPLNKGIIDIAVKACAKALEAVKIPLYDNRLNVVRLTESGNVNKQMVIKPQNSPISEIAYFENVNSEDCHFVIWDMTELMIDNARMSTPNGMNIFVMRTAGAIHVNVVCDENLLDLSECALFMNKFNKFVSNPTYMLL